MSKPEPVQLDTLRLVDGGSGNVEDGDFDDLLVVGTGASPLSGGYGDDDMDDYLVSTERSAVAQQQTDDERESASALEEAVADGSAEIRQRRADYQRDRQSHMDSLAKDKAARGVSRNEVQNRIDKYLNDNDDDCKESATLVAIVVIGLMVSLSIIGFLQIARHSSVKYKGSHASGGSVIDGQKIPNWWAQHIKQVENETRSDAALSEDIAHPLFRNDLLQTMHSTDVLVPIMAHNELFSVLSLMYGRWVPTAEQLKYPFANEATVEREVEQEEEESVEGDIAAGEVLLTTTTTEPTPEPTTAKVAAKPTPQPTVNKAVTKPTPKPTVKATTKPTEKETAEETAEDNVKESANDSSEGAAKESEARRRRLSLAIEGEKEITFLQGNRALKHQMSFPWRSSMELGKTYDNDVHEWRCYLLQFTSEEERIQADINKLGFKTTLNFLNMDMEEGFDYVRVWVNSEEYGVYSGRVDSGQFARDGMMKRPSIWLENGITIGDKTHASIVMHHTMESLRRNFYAFDICMQIVTDSTRTFNGFESQFVVEFENPKVVHWSDWSQCQTEKPFGANALRWDGTCGIGMSHRSVDKCLEDKNLVDEMPTKGSHVRWTNRRAHPGNSEAQEHYQKLKERYTDLGFRRHPSDPRFNRGNANGDEMPGKPPKMSKKQLPPGRDTPLPPPRRRRLLAQTPSIARTKDGSGNMKNPILGVRRPMKIRPSMTLAERGWCQMGETETRYCLKKTCSNATQPKVPTSGGRVHGFNGIGRIDPDAADLFEIKRAANDKFDIAQMIKRMNGFLKNLVASHFDERVLTNAVAQKKWKGATASRMRLGIKLVRSLLLGETFTVGFTGATATAGDGNMFASSYPMQLQSLLRPLWAEIGYKGAAFRVKNNAIGGLGTMQTAWCLPQIVGNDVDVVLWESFWKDSGKPDKVALENHLRLAMSLPRRPVWHSLVAGKMGMKTKSSGKKKSSKKKSDFEAHAMDDAWRDLAVYYNDAGAGVVEFQPAYGLAPMAKMKMTSAYNNEDMYVNDMHPTAKGHRVYAEQMAYFYVTAALNELKRLKAVIVDEMGVSQPALELYPLLEDPPRVGLPVDSGKDCGSFCLSKPSVDQWCAIGAQPSDAASNLKEFTVENNGWQWDAVAKDTEQPLTDEKGGQGPIDVKMGWIGNSQTGKLKIAVNVVGHGFVTIYKSFSEWGTDDNSEHMQKWMHVTMDADSGKPRRLVCLEHHKHRHRGSENVPTLLPRNEGGCVLQMNKGKHTLTIEVTTRQNVNVWAIASF